MQSPILSKEHILEAISFVGTTLGPFFLFDPVLDADVIAPSFRAMAELPVEAGADEWPFVDALVAANALGQMREGAGVPPDDLAAEFRRLFVGPGPKAAAPWGSVYTDKDCVVFGRSWLELRKWLRSNGVAVAGSRASARPGAADVAFPDIAGLVVHDTADLAATDVSGPDGFPSGVFPGSANSADCGVACDAADIDCSPHACDSPQSDEPEDHIGTMLLMMAWLADNHDDLLEEYLSQHFLTWAPHFLKLMEEATGHSFYRGLAQLTAASLQGIQDALGLEVDEPRFYR